MSDNHGNHNHDSWTNVFGFIISREKRDGKLDKKSTIEFLREKLGKESTKNGVRNLFWRAYSVLVLDGSYGMCW